jgi:hypothetical protein
MAGYSGDIGFAPDGYMYVTDGPGRVIGFAPPFSAGESPSIAIGQPDLATTSCTTSQSGLCYPTGLGFDSSGNLWVVDARNNRVVEFEGPTFTTGMPASRVIGQPDFTSNTFGTTQTGLQLSYSMGNSITKPAFAPDGTLWIGDVWNHRILGYGGTTTTTVTLDGSGNSGTILLSASGTTVTIAGSEPDAYITITSQLLGTVQPSGTVAVGGGPLQYYDVSMTGSDSGTARVCITNSQVNTGSDMSYYDGSAWVDATVRPIVPPEVCADIPVSAMHGTPMATVTPPTTTSVTCGSATLTVGVTTSCTATVAGSSPTGSVLWSLASGAGSVSSPSSTCTLSSGHCQLTVKGAGVGPVRLLATYSGDSRNLASAGSTDLTVNHALALSPSSGAVGTSVTMTGSNFTSSHSLTITYDGSASGMPTTCTTDASGNVSSGCTFTVPSSSVLGSHIVSASDGTNNATATFTVTLLGVTCSKSTVAVGSATTCKATVHASGSTAPTGYVAWSSSSIGTFSKASCKLLWHGSYSTCTVKFKPTAIGSSVILTANYGGDSKNPSTAGAYNLVVTAKAAKTTLSCRPASVLVGSPTIIYCKAKVIGYLPTGTMTWSQSGTGSVSLSSTTCALVSLRDHNQATCSVTMTGTTVGLVMLQGTYSGDPNNLGSYRAAKLTIKL